MFVFCSGYALITRNLNVNRWSSMKKAERNNRFLWTEKAVCNVYGLFFLKKFLLVFFAFRKGFWRTFFRKRFTFQIRFCRFEVIV